MKTGKVSENIIKRSVIKTIEEKSAARMTDCALFTGYVANEAKGDCGAHAMVRAINRCTESGFVPTQASVNITMPSTMREKRLKEIVSSYSDMAKEHGIHIDSGHSESVDGIACPIVSVSLLGKRQESVADAEPIPDMSIVMTKWMALSGTVWIASEHSRLPALRYPDFLLKDAVDLERFLCTETEAKVARCHGDTYMYSCGDGGIFAALWKFADRAGMGLEVDLRSIPVRQETIELSEVFDINPYKLRGDGALIVATSDPDGLIKELEQRDIKATYIGRLTKGRDRVLLSGEERRYLEEPTQDEQVRVLCYNGKSKPDGTIMEE